MNQIQHIASPEELGRRIKAARAQLGLTQEEAANVCGLPKRTYETYERSEIKHMSMDKLRSLSEGLGIDITVSDEARSQDLDSSARQESAELAHIPLSRISASAGSGNLAFEDLIERYISFDKQQLERETGEPAGNLMAMPVTGNSMYDTMKPGDTLIIARQNGRPVIDSGIYIFRSHYMGLVIKRAMWDEDGTLHLRSDNDEVDREFVIEPDNESHWEVIGHVRKIISSV